LIPDRPPLGVRSGRIVQARKLLRRSARRRQQKMLVEGPQALSLALGRVEFDEVFATAASADRHPELLGRLAQAGTEVTMVTDEAAASLSETVTPQRLVGVGVLPQLGLESLPDAPRLVAVLVEARDPGNLGTIVRTADAAGADAVVLAGDSVDPFGGKAIRASAGSVFTLPVIDGVEIRPTLERLAGAGCRPFAADGHAQLDLDHALDAGELDGPTAWVFGNEARGLPPEVIHFVTGSGGTSLRVPVYGAAESLNLAAAAAVCLYSSARAQRKWTGEGVGE
jgi:RNA methyltransferase, TrmH family